MQIRILVAWSMVGETHDKDFTLEHRNGALVVKDAGARMIGRVGGSFRIVGQVL